MGLFMGRGVDGGVVLIGRWSSPEVARAAKEVINGRGKRGRKRKSAALEADEPEPEQDVARGAKEAINGRGKRGRKGKSKGPSCG
jgi:hypothetical protein